MDGSCTIELAFKYYSLKQTRCWYRWRQGRDAILAIVAQIVLGETHMYTITYRLPRLKKRRQLEHS